MSVRKRKSLPIIILLTLIVLAGFIGKILRTQKSHQVLTTIPSTSEISIDPNKKMNGFSHLSTQLNELYTSWFDNPEESIIKAREQGLEIKNGRVLVTLIIEDENSANIVINTIPALGGEVFSHYKSWVDAWVPIDKLDEISSLSGVNFVQKPVKTAPLF